jgi:hypothetical protein
MMSLGRLCGLAFALAGAASLGAMGTAPAGLGCQTHECDPVFACISGSGLMTFVSQASDCTSSTPGDASIPGYNTNVVVSGDLLIWDTSPVNGPWLDYPGNRTYIINFPPGLAGNTVLNYSAWIAADNPQDGAPHTSFVTGPGYVAQFQNTTPYQLTVLNGSCAGYSLRIEVQAQLAADAGDNAQTTFDAGDAGGAGAAD